jgi:hypothetical protein
MQMPEPRTAQEIALLAQDFLAGRVYSIEDIPENLIQMVFMPLALSNPFADMTEEEIQQLFIFGVYGKDTTAAIGVNGYPIFYSIQVWPRDDATRAVSRARAAAAAITGEMT